jgi:hypothetical protein
MRSFALVSASLLCGCNVIFGLDSAEDRAGTAASSSSGDAGASSSASSSDVSSSTSSGASSGEVSSSGTSSGGGGGGGGTSSGEGGAGDGGGGAGGTGGAGGDGGSGPCVLEIAYTHTATFEDFPWPDWDCSGSCQATSGRETNGFVASFDPAAGTAFLVRATDWVLAVGDRVELSASSRAVFEVESATLSLRNAKGDPSEVFIPLSTEEAPDMHDAIGEVVVTETLEDAHFFVHATGEDRFDVDDVVVTVRRCR